MSACPNSSRCDGPGTAAGNSDGAFLEGKKITRENAGQAGIKEGFMPKSEYVILQKVLSPSHLKYSAVTGKYYF